MGLYIFGRGNNGTAQWVSESCNQRGSWSILSSCIITLVLCLYTSLHLNIPAHNATFLETFGLKVKWILIGLLAPEVVVYNAWRQRKVATLIVAELRKIYGQPLMKSRTRQLLEWLRGASPKETAPIDDKPWSLVHGFYIVMGGYAFDPVVKCLTTDRLKGLFPYISEQEIRDKSKANSLAKALVCIQALWFGAQFLSRIALRLPVSLLELNTFAHSLCALLVYAFWWAKPLDIVEPTVIDIEGSDVARYICVLAWATGKALSDYIKLDGQTYDHLSPKSSYPCENDSDLVSQDSPNIQNDFSRYIRTRAKVVASHRNEGPGALRSIMSTQFAMLRGRSKAPHIISDPQKTILLKYGDPIPSTLLWVSIAWELLKVDEIVLERLRLLRVEHLDPGDFRGGRHELVQSRRPKGILRKREPNLVDLLMTDKPDSRGTVLDQHPSAAVGMAVSGFLYGGLHALGWGGYTIRTPTERMLWNVSSVAVLSGGTCVVGYRALMRTHTPWRVRLGLVYIGKLMISIYVCCRAFLAIEVFWNLLYLDPGVFQNPEWSIYFPHIA